MNRRVVLSKICGRIVEKWDVEEAGSLMMFRIIARMRKNYRVDTLS